MKPAGAGRPRPRAWRQRRLPGRLAGSEVGGSPLRPLQQLVPRPSRSGQAALVGYLQRCSAARARRTGASRVSGRRATAMVGCSSARLLCGPVVGSLTASVAGLAARSAGYTSGPRTDAGAERALSSRAGSHRPCEISPRHLRLISGWAPAGLAARPAQPPQRGHGWPASAVAGTPAARLQLHRPAAPEAAPCRGLDLWAICRAQVRLQEAWQACLGVLGRV